MAKKAEYIHKPFLKWAGNKFRLLNKIIPHLPEGARLIEPFSGTAALFLNTDFSSTWLNDLNEDLINLYQDAAKRPDELIKKTRRLFSEKNNTEAVYYRYRSLFNKTPASLERSALFLYLNRHSYNGLCRYNKRGEFNVPFGRYKRPYLPEKELYYFSEKSVRAHFTHEPFQTVMKSAQPGDIVYCDPPYAPLSKTAHFTSYHARPFLLDDQIELAQLALQLAEKKIPVIISNHDTALTRKLYQEAKLVKFSVQRFISTQAHNRLPAKELLGIFLP